MKVKTPEGGMGVIGRFFVTVLIILVVLLVTIFFAVRTRGGHAFIEERIERQLGVALHIERMRIGWPYALVMEGLRTEGFDEAGERPGFAGQEVRLGPSLRARYALFVRRGHVRLVADDQARWTPACFARLSELPYGDLADITDMLPFASGHAALEIEGGRVEWFGRDGAIMSSAHGIHYAVTPVRIPGRHMRHHALSLYSMTRPNGARMSDVSCEWLSSGTIGNIELRDNQLEGTVTP